MEFAEWTLADLASNVALDEALLLRADEGGPGFLRLWEWPGTAVVLGAGGVLRQEVDTDACQADGVAIVRRGSGGGAVVLGRGCLLYSAVLPFHAHPAFDDVNASYRVLLTTLADALAPLAPGIAPAGTSDLAWRGRKCSGNSQHRKRQAFLHHGTLLYDFDAKTIARYLRMPPRQPAYRAGRGHEDFVGNLPATRLQLVECLRGWARLWGLQGEKMDEMLRRDAEKRARTLVAEKYGAAAWTERR